MVFSRRAILLSSRHELIKYASDSRGTYLSSLLGYPSPDGLSVEIQRVCRAVPGWFSPDSLSSCLMAMVISNRDQGANERTWAVVSFFDLCVLDFLHVGGLQRRIGQFVIARFFVQVYLHCPSNEREGCHRVPKE